jgi:hypothetical protein
MRQIQTEKDFFPLQKINDSRSQKQTGTRSAHFPYRGLTMHSSIPKIFFSCILMMLMLTGCTDFLNGINSIHGSGRMVTQKRTVAECEGITLKSIGNVYLEQSDTQSIRIEADDNIISKITTEKQNGVLVIELPGGGYSNATVRVYAAMKDIKSLKIEGAGNIECVHPIAAPSLDCRVSGAGSITLQGTCDDLSCSMSGVGSVSGKKFISKSCTANVSGVGSCTVNVTDRLDARVSGVGSISYYGNPASVHRHVSGVGSISKCD